MHFITFPVASTNIFPLSNSKYGGQLVTEFNLKSRDTVITDPNIKYSVGPSFLHSLDDFKVQLLKDAEIEEYSATKTYIKGDYCSYDYVTYVRNTDESERTLLSTGVKEYELKDAEDKPLAVDTIYSVTAGTTEIPDTDYSLQKTEDKTLLIFDDDHIPQTGVNIILIYKGPETFNADHWTETTISSSVLQIAPGRAVINGHYVENLSPMIIDLNLANAELKRQSKPALFGELSIGIKSYFSTENTMSGSMLIENTDDMYVGIQLVITDRKEFKTPSDCPSATEEGNATADIKLADFTYVNGSISSSSIIPNAEATRYIPSERIYNFSKILDDNYVKAQNLDEKEFYTYSGKSDNWCESTSSLMVWDKDYNQHLTKVKPTIEEAGFYQDTSGNVKLVVPHKQPDGGFTNDNGDTIYYENKVFEFPTANYARGTSGIVTEQYTQNIKDIAAVINTYKQFTNGKQIMYLPVLSADSEGKLSYEFPTKLDEYHVGDYILVREDYTANITEDEGASPATMYFVLPGGVTAISSNPVTTQPPGIRLGNPDVRWEGDGATPPEPGNPDAETLLDIFSYTQYLGTTDDYFEIVFHNIDDTVQTSYYYRVTAAGPKSWSDAVMLTGGVPLASESQVGGFYNASTDTAYADAGYVYLDETGHLRLVDYALLRSGALAYQLGESFSVPKNQTLDYIQNYLDEVVNARVAFYSQPVLSSYTPMIDVFIPISASEEGVLNIYDIDSRFGTGVYLHFLLDDTSADYSNITINIIDCEKIRIDSSITTLTSGPIINLYRSCLYYDASVINYIRVCDEQVNSRESDFTGFEGLTLWYSKFSPSDPDLILNGMEIAQSDVSAATQDISFWDENISNDNHYNYALRSITLSNTGKAIGCSLFVCNSSTATTSTDTHIIIGGKFILPQGSKLNYPEACIDAPLQITGTFTTAYQADNSYWVVTETSFTARTGTYDYTDGMGEGSIAFNSKTDFLPPIYTANISNIGGWDTNSYHIFYGGTTVGV